MDFRCIGLAVLVCLTALGCRRDPYMDAYFDMLNAEKRVLEDRLYEMEYQYEQAAKELHASRCTGSVMKENPTPAGDRRDDTTPTQDPNGPPDIQMPPGVPDIELPPGFDDPTGQSNNRSVLRSASFSSDLDDNAVIRHLETAAEGGAPHNGVMSDQPVEYIYLNPRRTGGEDFDNSGGDDGIAVLIEPRDRNGRFVPQAGEVSIALLDPEQQGPAARFARWDFDRQVSQSVLRTGSLDRGLYFRVPWPEAPPDTPRLHLFVRFVTSDGRKLEANREIIISPSGRVARRWTPRPARTQPITASRPQQASYQETESVETSPTVNAVYEDADDSPGPAKPAEPAQSTGGQFWAPSR